MDTNAIISRISRRSKAIILILAVMICSMMLPLPAVYAEESGTCGDNLTWTYNAGRLTVSGNGAMTNFFDNNMPPWYGHASEITSAVIEEGVTTLGELTFYECKSLSNVVLPSTLREIGVRAFKDCTSLTYVNLPGNVYFIAESAFENCSSLNGIRLDEGITVLGDKAFYRCASLSSITVPASVEYLGMVVFAYCENLVRAEIRCPIEKLPDWTFYGCNKLTSVALPDTLKSVGSLAFFNCPSLSGVYYSGDNIDEIYDEIVEENENISSNGGIVGDKIGDSAGTVEDNQKDNSAVYTTVTETENSIITVEEEVSYNNEDLTPALEEETVVATIVNEEGWEELSEVLDEIIENIGEEFGSGDGTENDQPTVNVDVQLPDTNVPGSFLSDYAGENIIVNFTTPDGAAWQIDMTQVTKDQIDAEKQYDLSYRISDVEEKIEGIDSETVFQLNFSQDHDFNMKVKVRLGLSYAGRYATLYQKDGSKIETVHNVWIDSNGNAWFYLASIDKGMDYYIGIDVEGVTRSNSIVPPSMYGEYAGSGLVDAEGNLYKITGRTSRWGITGGQFALYAGLALGFMVLVVAVIMITRNHMHKSRAAAKAAAASAAAKKAPKIDRDALYEEVMRDMLKKDDQNKKQ